MQIARIYTKPGTSSPDAFDMPVRDYVDADGGRFVVPAHWSAIAIDVLVNTVFFKGIVPDSLPRLPVAGMPEWLWPAAPLLEEPQGETPEHDIRAVLHRIAGSLTLEAKRAGIFDTDEDAAAFYDELRYLMFHQIAAPECGLWSTAGVTWAYGIPHGSFLPDARIASFPDQAGLTTTLPYSGVTVPRDYPKGNMLKRIKILAEAQSIEAEAGSLTITLPVEHIDSRSFITDSRQKDMTALATAIGNRLMTEALNRVMDACDRDSVLGFDPVFNKVLDEEVRAAIDAGVPFEAVDLALSYARQGYEEMPQLQGKKDDDDFASPAFHTCLSVPDDFIETALTGHGFMMTDEGRSLYHIAAPELWEAISHAVWTSGEPTLFFRDSASSSFTGTEPARSGKGSMIFMTGTEGASATLNMLALAGTAPAVVDTAKMTHAVRIMTIALEASISLMKPSQKTIEYRPIVIGCANLPTLLMSQGMAYDSAAGRNTAALIASYLSGAATLASAELADAIGAFDGYALAAKDYLSGVKDKMAMLSGHTGIAKGITRRPSQFNPALCPDAALPVAAKAVWDKAYAIGKEQGFRHAHVTGMQTDILTQSLLGAQTRDITPETHLVRFESFHAERDGADAFFGKKLNPAVPKALAALGYTTAQIDDIYAYAAGQGTLFDAPAINHESLLAKGLDEEMIQRLEAAIKTTQHIRYIFNPWTIGAELALLVEDPEGDILTQLGYSEDDIDQANVHACGTMTLEGAPHLKPQHLPVFDCIAPLGDRSVRRIGLSAQVMMQAAIEPFLSGAVAHTISLDHHTTIDDTRKLLLSAWESGVKQVSLYREGSSLLMPLAMPLGLLDTEDETSTSLTRKHA